MSYPHKIAKLTNVESDSTSYEEDSLEDLTIIDFDELIQLYQQRLADKRMLKDSFCNFVEQTHLLYEEWIKKMKEYDSLKNEIDKKNEEINEYAKCLGCAKKLFNEENRKRKLAENESAVLKDQITKFLISLVKDGTSILADDTKEQISNLYPGRLSFEDAERLNAIKEADSTGSILSEFSYSCSEDDLDYSRYINRFIKDRKLQL